MKSPLSSLKSVALQVCASRIFLLRNLLKILSNNTSGARRQVIQKFYNEETMENTQNTAKNGTNDNQDYKPSRSLLFLLGLAIIVIGIYLLSTSPSNQANNTGANITISMPKPGSDVGTAFVATGLARVFENQFNWDVLDPNTSKVVATGTAYAYAPDAGKFGYYSISVQMPLTYKKSSLVFEAFDYSAKDGSKTDIASTTLTYHPENKLTNVGVFYPNTVMDPNATDCSQVFEVYRTIGDTPGIARASLIQLIKGPTQEEQQYGFITDIPGGVQINGIKLTSGDLTADFDQTLQQGVGGSCATAAIRAQITKTLTQFPTVKNVTISIGGKTADVLQP